MHVVTGRLEWAPEHRHSLHRRVEEADGLSLVETQYVELLEDETCVSVDRFAGEAETLRELLATTPGVLSADILDDDRLVAFVHKEAIESSVSLHTLLRTHEVAIAWPLTYVGPGEMAVTFTGDQEQVATVVDSLPTGLSFSLRRTGSFPTRRADVDLTDRQREILGTAVRMGYYDRPRSATQREIAAALGVSAGTVAEHLRKIETAVMPTLL